MLVQVTYLENIEVDIYESSNVELVVDYVLGLFGRNYRSMKSQTHYAIVDNVGRELVTISTVDIKTVPVVITSTKYGDVSVYNIPPGQKIIYRDYDVDEDSECFAEAECDSDGHLYIETIYG
jgi:hypothetical protein